MLIRRSCCMCLIAATIAALTGCPGGKVAPPASTDPESSTSDQSGSDQSGSSAAPAPQVDLPGIISVAPAQGPTTGGTAVTIVGSNFQSTSQVLLGGFAAQTVQVANDQLIIAVTPAQSAGSVDVLVLTPQRPAARLTGGFQYVDAGPVDDGNAPRVVGATSMDTHTVLVTFSKPMGPTVTDPANYEVTGSDSSVLILNPTTAPALMSDQTTVALTTLAQDATDYTVHVAHVKDTFGHELAAPNGLLGPPSPDPSRATFHGTAASGNEASEDTDGDGLSDVQEMKGWIVTIKLANGTSEQYHVTSDPFNAHSDGDPNGLDDGIKHTLALDPRRTDTDRDGVSDTDEWNIWYSDPTNQDSDGDGLTDGLEVNFFHTSPIMADTDGDQLSDSDELLNRGRNPLIADVPSLIVETEYANLVLDQRYTYSDQFGREQSEEDSVSGTIERDSSHSRTESGGTVTSAEWHLGGKVKVGYEQKAGVATLEAEADASHNTQSTNEWTSESAQHVSSSYNQAINHVNQLTSVHDVTREILGAEITSGVTIRSGNNIAFRVSDLEVSVLKTDPEDRSKFTAIATLLPANPSSVFNLGPSSPALGPFVFTNRDIFPSEVEELMKDPRGLVFKVANFNITDELGRNFAFSSQEVSERTCTLIIDYGNGQNSMYQIATAGPFDEFGRPQGISVDAALQAIGLHQWRNRQTGSSEDDPELGNPSNPADTRPKPSDADVQASYGMRPFTRIVDGVSVTSRVLTRVRGVQEDFDFDTVEPNKANDGAFWAVFFSDPSHPDQPFTNASTDFDKVRLLAGQVYALAFVQDQDKDGLTSREEFYYGSSDSDPDTDHDGLPDFLEIRGAWNVDGLGEWRVATSRLPGGYRAYSAPFMKNSDGSSDPNASMEDGEKYGMCGYQYDPNGLPLQTAYALGYIDANDPDPNHPTVHWTLRDPNTVTRDAAFPCFAQDPNGNCTSTPLGAPWSTSPWYKDIDPNTGAPRAFPCNRGALDPRKIDTDEDGISDYDEVHGYYVDLFEPDSQGRKQRILVFSDPLKADTDGDGLIDGMERLLGTNPVVPDADAVLDDDQDGLPNRVEKQGWFITLNGYTNTQRVATLANLGNVADVAISGSLAYVAATNYFYIINIATPANPQILGSFNAGTNGAKHVALSADGHYAYVGGDTSFRRIDCSNPAAPTVNATLSFPVSDMSISANTAYVVNDNLLRLVSLDTFAQSGNSITLTTGGAVAVGVGGSYAYVTASSIIMAVDLSQRAVVWFHNYGAPINGITVSDNYAYVAWGGNGLMILDLSTPNAPVPLSYLTWPGMLTKSTTLVGSRALVSNLNGTVTLVDVSDPLQPAVVDAFTTGGVVLRTAFAGGLAYAATGTPGLQVLYFATRVYSNPNDPDSDHDGIPDYVEWVIGTNPWYSAFQILDPTKPAPGVDTDGDGLTDFEEWNGTVPPQKADELSFCSLVPNCHGYAVNPTPIGTDPTNRDTDNDGLSDGDEIRIGWLVHVNGDPAGYQVFSDPLVADTDHDGLLDGQEKLLGTDPRKVDTDDDGTSDGEEASRTGVVGEILQNGTYVPKMGTRDPLTPDQRVTVTYRYLFIDYFGVIGYAHLYDENGNSLGNLFPEPPLFAYDLGAISNVADHLLYWADPNGLTSTPCSDPSQTDCLRYCAEANYAVDRTNPLVLLPTSSSSRSFILSPAQYVQINTLVQERTFNAGSFQNNPTFGDWGVLPSDGSGYQWHLVGTPPALPATPPNGCNDDWYWNYRADHALFFPVESDVFELDSGPQTFGGAPIQVHIGVQVTVD